MIIYAIIEFNIFIISFVEYVKKIFDIAYKMAQENNSTTAVTPVPPPLSSSYAKPNKNEAISLLRSRFI